MLRNNIAPYYTGYKIKKATRLELCSVYELIRIYDKCFNQNHMVD